MGRVLYFTVNAVVIEVETALLIYNEGLNDFATHPLLMEYQTQFT